MSVNPESIEDTKRQIRGLVNEIAALAKSGATAEEFYPEFLQRILSALAAPGGAVWLLDEDRQMRLQYQINAEPTILGDETDDAQRHLRLIRRATVAGQSLLVPPYSGTTDGDAEGNPTRFLLVLAPLQHDGNAEGIIEVFQRAEAAPDTQRGYLRFLDQMCDLAGEWLRSQKLRVFSDRQVLWQNADSYARAVHESLDVKETAYTVANEGRRLIGCDRVTVAMKTGNKCRAMAISGQDTIENRSNIVAALNNLATRVVAAGEPLWHDGRTEDLPPQIEDALEDYVDLSHGRHIAVLPLREPQDEEKNNDEGAAGRIDRDDSHKGETIGALIVEQIQSDIPQDVFQARVDLVYEHGTRALANSSSHSNLFLMPVWRALGRAMWLVRGKTLPKTLAVCGAVLLAALALVFYQMDMDLEAEGTLQPNVQRVVFAQVDGRVEDVLVKFNQTVQANEVLLRLENKELDIQISDLLGQQSQTQEELSSIAATVRQITGQVMDDSEAQKLLARKNQLTVQARTLGEKLRLLQEKQRSLVVRAPIAGVITSWEPRKTLLNRPVQTGQAILEIADLDQPMHIEARLPEKKISHLDRYTKAQLADSPSYNELPAEFILVSDPDTVLNGALPLNEIGLRAEPDETEGAVVRLRVNPDWEALSKMNPKPGTKVTTDLKCGKRSAGYVLLYEPYEWVCQNVLF